MPNGCGVIFTLKICTFARTVARIWQNADKEHKENNLKMPRQTNLQVPAEYFTLFPHLHLCVLSFWLSWRRYGLGSSGECVLPPRLRSVQSITHSLTWWEIRCTLILIHDINCTCAFIAYSHLVLLFQGIGTQQALWKHSFRMIINDFIDNFLKRLFFVHFLRLLFRNMILFKYSWNDKVKIKWTKAGTCVQWLCQ